MASDAELMQLMESAQNGGVDPNAVAPSTTVAAPVVGTPEGPGIPPIAPVPASVPSPDATGGFNPDTVSTGAMPAPGAPVVPTPVPLPVKGIDTRAADLARQTVADEAQAQANKTPLQAASADAEAGGLEDSARIQRDQAVEVQAEAQAQKDGLAQARQIADDAHEEVKNFKFSDYMGDKTGAAKVWSNIAYALGAAGASGSSGNGINTAAEKIKMINAQNFQREKEKLSSLQNIAAYKERGVTDLQSQYRDDLAKLQIKQALGLKAASDEAKAFLLRTNVPLKEAENNELVQKLRADGDKDYAQIIEKLQHDKAIESLERAKLAQTGPENPQALAILAHLAQQPGVKQEDLYAAAAKLGIRDVNKAVLPIQKNPDKEEADKAKKQAGIDSRTVMVGGVPVGLAPTTRVVKQIEDRAVSYQDAISKLEQLKASGDTIPIGSPAYDAAVLAVAATTQANASDRTTAHEAGTIKKYGLINNAAIDSTLAHLKQRQSEFLKNLQPLPSDESATPNTAPAAQDKSMPSASLIRSLPESDRKDAIEATQALGGPDDKAARKLLKHLGVM